MFRLVLKAVGAIGVTTEQDLHVESKDVALELTHSILSSILGHSVFKMVDLDEGQYTVMSFDIPVGGFTLTEVH